MRDGFRGHFEQPDMAAATEAKHRNTVVAIGYSHTWDQDHACTHAQTHARMHAHKHVCLHTNKVMLESNCNLVLL